jgi:5-(carboxyamino)imidazole ribonucleotide synthase
MVDVLTIEIENVNVEALKFLESNSLEVLPQSKVIEIIQDKSKQKEFYNNNQIPTSSYKIFAGKNELKESVSKGEISLPFIWKASRMGYDGYGVNKISNNKDLEKIDDCHCIVEELISIKKELSVMVASRKSGELINYPVVEMEFNSDSNQVEYILSPAKINNDLKSDAEKLAIQVAEKLQITGILAVEMFLTSENEILVNEVAPRPHNSYHFSIEGSYTSQFEQLLRSILDMPLGSTKIIEAAVMVNLVGEKGSNGPVIYKNFDQIIGLEGVNPHIYGKFETRFNRKMGHVTVINENIDKAKELAKEIKETIIITSEK